MGEPDGHPRRLIDVAAYAESSQRGPCFVCEIACGNPKYRDRHHMIYEDAGVLVFLNRFPTVLGYTLVCPRQHREGVTADFGLEEYLALQRVVHRVGEAVRRAVPTERLYVLSLGSQQGNRHVHWHVVPLPPGVPYEEQQIAILDLERGVLDVPSAAMAELAGRIREQLMAFEA